MLNVPPDIELFSLGESKNKPAKVACTCATAQKSTLPGNEVIADKKAKTAKGATKKCAAKGTAKKKAAGAAPARPAAINTTAFFQDGPSGPAFGQDGPSGPMPF